MILRTILLTGICVWLSLFLCLGLPLMGKHGNKRKKDKCSPNQAVDQENKRQMAGYNNHGVTSPMQTQTGQFNSHIVPATFTYTPNMFNNGQPMMAMPPSQPYPQSPGTKDSGDQGVMGLILQRLDNMDKKLGQLESIQSSLTNITVKVNDMEAKVKNLESKVNIIESSRDFDTEAVENLNKKQREIDSLLDKMKKLEAEQSVKENDLRAQVLDIQCRNMRDNLIFYRLPEEQGETDNDCMRKILSFIEEKLEIENATSEIKLHRAHRMGKYDPTRIRPIVAKFAYYPDRERVRKNASKLRDTNFGISQQFPKSIMEKRKKLVPIMKAARQNGQDAYIVVDKLYIDKRLYREPQ